MSRFPCEDVRVGDWVYIYDESNKAEPKLKYKVVYVFKNKKKIVVEVTQRHMATCPLVKGWPDPERPKIRLWNVWHWRVDRRNMTLVDNE